jgi:hypothetical protein
MRRPQSASGLAAVTAGLFVATLTVMPAEAAKAPSPAADGHVFRAAAACTPWTDEFTPPATIRVLRTQRDLVPPEVVGTVQEVDFRSYVATTMAVEWPEQYPIATLKAGAVATKQFAWYHVIHPRGGTVVLPDGSTTCYDVVDNTIDQYYYPEKYGPGLPDGPGPKIGKALDLTWGITVRKYSRRTQSSRFFLTGYRSGEATTCGADANGFKLFHHSTRACGKDGLTFREILRRYLMPNLEIVTAGRHDVVGSRHGDATAMVLNDEGLQVAHVWSLGGADPTPSSRAGARIAAAELVGFGSDDVSGDGKDDLVWLSRTGPGTGRVSVALSDSAGYGGGQTWFDGRLGVPLNGARLMVGDFHADSQPDVAVLARADAEGQAQLIVLRKKAGNAFGPPVRWWSGPLDLKDLASAWAGDVSGDGRADLIVRQGTGRRGVTIRTAVTRSPLPREGARMGSLRVGFGAALDPAKVKVVPGDANRDGREDVLLLIGRGGRAVVERLQGQSYGGFKRVPVWAAPRSAGIAVEKTRLGAADMDFDGMTDLVLFSRHPRGTRIQVLKTRYSTMKAGPSEVEPFDWRSVRPY